MLHVIFVQKLLWKCLWDGGKKTEGQVADLLQVCSVWSVNGINLYSPSNVPVGSHLFLDYMGSFSHGQMDKTYKTQAFVLTNNSFIHLLLRN